MLGSKKSIIGAASGPVTIISSPVVSQSRADPSWKTSILTDCWRLTNRSAFGVLLMEKNAQLGMQRSYRRVLVDLHFLVPVQETVGRVLSRFGTCRGNCVAHRPCTLIANTPVKSYPPRQPFRGRSSSAVCSPPEMFSIFQTHPYETPGESHRNGTQGSDDRSRRQCDWEYATQCGTKRTHNPVSRVHRVTTETTERT
jgi:hypothetical protein